MVKNRLRQMRLEKMMTIEQLHKASGVCIATITKIEHYYPAPLKPLTMFKLANALGRPVTEVFYVDKAGFPLDPAERAQMEG